MKKVTLAAILLVSLSFTAVKTNDLLEEDEVPSGLVTKASADTIKISSESNDTLSINEIKDIEEVSSLESTLLSGKVSWYGGKFHGRLTSSGERYDMNEYTAAHKTLPFGTKVKIINPKNGKEVIVRITDRGPFVPKREFDLSKAAFAELTSLNSGVLQVKYEVL